MSRRDAGVADNERLDSGVGVNLVEAIRNGDDFCGDGVNLAARIQELADPGGICVSGTACEQEQGIGQAVTWSNERMIRA